MRNVAQQNSSEERYKQTPSQTDKTLSQLLPAMCFSAKAHEAAHQEEMPLSIGPELGMQVGLQPCVPQQGPSSHEMSLLWGCPFLFPGAFRGQTCHLGLSLSFSLWKPPPAMSLLQPNLLSWFHASYWRTTFHQNTFLINTCWIWSHLGEKVQLIWAGGGSIFVVFFLVRNVPRSCEA